MTTDIVDRAYARLRACTTGDLRFDEHVRPIEYVIAGDGRLVAPVMVAMLQALETVLFVPELAEGAMEILVTLTRFAETDDAVAAGASGGALADRWRIHHGDPPDVNWALMEIDTARHEDHVIDGEALMRDNPLAAEEPRLCRRMNKEHPEDLRRLCLHVAGIEVERPVMVAIDPLGIDVRGRFDVIRIPWEKPAASADEAIARLDALIEAARRAPVKE